ncbi:MAG: Lrp/AsnC family transcriptional regulator [Bradyrhizobiaceae bacterium]|nr:Lrp/AsnC family transcriptional regulator [Bradyrhizobiaceae bacterium]
MDDFDIKLLKALQQDGRLTNNELAERIGLSASQCSRRRAALEESGVIESYHAVLSPAAVGLDVLVFIRVGLATQSPDSGEAFVRLIGGIEEVQEAFSLTGDTDFLIKMAVPDLKTLSHLLNDVLLPHQSVAHVHSYVVLDRVKQTTALPLRYLSDTRRREVRPQSTSRRRARVTR